MNEGTGQVQDAPAAKPGSGPEVKQAEFQGLDAGPAAGDTPRTMDMLLDLSVPVTIELGRSSMLIRDVLQLQRGSVVELERLANEPVDVLVNGKKMAEGEVVVIEKHFGIRITNLAAAGDQISEGVKAA
jgi:flagellar motor switch protein FliN/FliY